MACRRSIRNEAQRWITANFDRCPAHSRSRSRPHVGVPRLRRHHQHRATSAMHLLERAAPDGWWALARAVRARRDRQPGVHVRPVGAGRGRRGDVARDRRRGAARSGLRPAGRRRCAPPAPSSPWCPTGSASTSRTRVAPLGLDVLTNAVDFTTRELLFPHEDRCCPCSSCGVCKQAPIKDAQYRGQTTVLIGDGASDRKAALLADVVFAKDALAVVVRRVRRRVRAVRHPRRRAPHAVPVDERRVRHRRAHAAHRRGAVPTLEARGHDRRSRSTTGSGSRWVARSAGWWRRARDTGVLFCWTGTGASIAANKVPGVRAALCTDAATAAGARTWNDANVLVMGSAARRPRWRARCSTSSSSSRLLPRWRRRSRGRSGSNLAIERETEHVPGTERVDRPVEVRGTLADLVQAADRSTGSTGSSIGACTAPGG